MRSSLNPWLKIQDLLPRSFFEYGYMIFNSQSQMLILAIEYSINVGFDYRVLCNHGLIPTLAIGYSYSHGHMRSCLGFESCLPISA